MEKKSEVGNMFRGFNEVFVKNFELFFNCTAFPLSNYVKETLLEIKTDKMPSVIVYPDGEELNTMLISYISLYSRYMNFFGDVNELTEDLAIDDYIYYDNRLGKFKGKKIYKEWGSFTDYFPKNIRDCQAIKIEFAKNAIDYITEKDFYKITRYEGGATRLNNIGNAKSNKIVNELIEMFELSKTSISTLIDSSVLYVKNKCDADDIINNITVNYGEIKGKKLTEIVPLAYWTSGDKSINYKGNKHGLRPVVDFTCTLENAINLLYDKENIELVIIDLADFRGIDYNLIEQIIDLCEEIKLIMLLPFNKYNSFNDFFNNISYNSVIIDKAKAARFINDSINQSLQIKQRSIFENFINRKVEFLVINEKNDITFMNLYKKLKSLSSGGSNDERVMDLINKAFRIISVLKSNLVFNTPLSNENIDYIRELMSKFEVEAEVILKDSTFFSVDLLSYILDQLKKFVKKMISSNEMSNFIIDKIKYGSNKKILFIVQNNRVKAILDSYIKGRFMYQTIHCKIISKLQADIFYDVIYVIGVVPNEQHKSKLFSIFTSKKINFVYYQSYIYYIKKLYKKNTMPLLEERIDIDEKVNNLTQTPDKLDEYDLIQELTSLINEYNYRDAFRIYFGNTEEKEKIKCDYLINFNEYIGIFKNEYKVYRVNFQQEDLDYVKISNLSIGDEILILNEQFKSGEFIDDIVNALLLDEYFYKENNEIIELSKIWKRVLSDYLLKENISYSDLYKLLVNKGLKRTYSTFRNWIINDFIVGPDNEKDYELIFSLNHDYQVKWEAVYEACNKVRSLHIRLRHDIGKMIVESYFNNIALSNNLRYLEIDFMDKVSICEVDKIDKGEFYVPTYMVNSVKRKED